MDKIVMKDLAIVYCNNCRSYQTRCNGSIHECTKENKRGVFQLDEPALFKHKPCYREKK